MADRILIGCSDSDSSELEDDFDSLFTISKTKIAEILTKERPVEVIPVEITVEVLPADIDTTPSKKNKSELSPILVPDDEFTPPARGRGRGRQRGRGRGQAARGKKPTTHEQKLDLPPVYARNPSATNWSLDDSLKDVSIDLDDDNYEISVKVCWKCKTVTPFTIRKYQKLSSIFEFYANQEGVPQSQLQLTLGDRIVSPDDSPDSLALTVANILEGGIVTSTAAALAAQSGPMQPNRAASPVDVDSIQLKVRAKDSKQPVLIMMKKNQKMSVLMTKYAEKCELPLEKLKFTFDGDTLNPAETPEDLDLEGGEMIDLVIVN